MIYELFSLLFLASFICLIIGLIKPALFSKFIKGEITKKKLALIFGSATVVLFFLVGATAPKIDISKKQSIEQTANQTKPAEQINKPVEQPKAETTPTNTNKTVSSQDKVAAQKELDEIISLAKTAGLVVSYEFSDSAAVVYIGQVWYTQTVQFKKDFMAKIAILKKQITGYQHFEVRDAYSNEKVAEVTAFSGSLEVYK